MHEADTMTASSPVNADLPIDKMRRWYLAGDSNATIGGRLGLHQSKVRRVLLEAGVTMRSRREQVALTDRRAGVRPPSCDELDAGYVAQGLTAASSPPATDHRGPSAGTAPPLRDRATTAGYPPRAARGGAGTTTAATARRERRGPLPIGIVPQGRRRTRRHPPPHRRRRAPPSGSRAPGPAQVATRERVGAPLHQWWRDGRRDRSHLLGLAYHGAPRPGGAGIERRPAMVRTAVVSDDDVIECYVGERLSLRDTAHRLGVSIPRVRAIVARHGVLRAGSTRPASIGAASHSSTPVGPPSPSWPTPSTSPHTTRAWPSAPSSCRRGSLMPTSSC